MHSAYPAGGGIVMLRRYTVNGAKVVRGDERTGNATAHLIDSTLMPA